MPMVSVKHELTRHRYDQKFGGTCNDNMLEKAYEESDDQFIVHVSDRYLVS